MRRGAEAATTVRVTAVPAAVPAGAGDWLGGDEPKPSDQSEASAAAVMGDAKVDSDRTGGEDITPPPLTPLLAYQVQGSRFRV